METKNENVFQKVIKVSDGKVEVVFLPSWAGCLITAMGIMTAGGLFILYIVPDLAFFRALIGVIIGIIGTLFFGSFLLRVISAVMSGKTVLSVENGELKGKKNSVRIDRIKDIEWRGSGMRYLLVRTVDNKKMKFSTYNLVNDEPVNYVIDMYVIPHANSEFRANWERRRSERKHVDHQPVQKG